LKKVRFKIINFNCSYLLFQDNLKIYFKLLLNLVGSGSNAQYSIPAQNVLAQLLAPLLDITFGNQEKERVCTILTMVMYNVTPYLKNHT